MDTDDLEPIKRKPNAPDLATMSIEALGEYIGGLHREIALAEAMIKEKQVAKGAADAVFGSS